jgi:urease accessory protein
MKQVQNARPGKHRSKLQKFIFAASSALAPTLAFSHPGHVNELAHNAFYMDWIHLFTGLDHLLAMLATGLWVALAMANRMQQTSAIRLPGWTIRTSAAAAAVYGVTLLGLT